MEHYLFEDIQYVMKVPAGSKEERYPAILFLHGAGTRGNDIDMLKTNPFFTGTSRTAREDFPFVVFAPQCQEMTWFDVFERLKRFAKMVSEHPMVDPERLYLMGTSMGGYGTWQLAMSMAGLFAAIVPICGGGMHWNGALLKDTPVWAFHGKEDPVVPCIESIMMVESVNAAGGTAKLTLLENTEHNCWDYAYGQKELYDWLLGHRRAASRQEEDKSYQGSKLFG